MVTAHDPQWSYFPRNTHPPEWVGQFVRVVNSAAERIDTREVATSLGLTSDGVLAALRPGLVAQGYLVESGKTAADKIKRPVLFGYNGIASVSYELDAFHRELGIAADTSAAFYVEWHVPLRCCASTRGRASCSRVTVLPVVIAPHDGDMPGL